MVAKGIAVSAPRGTCYTMDSGDPKKDMEDAEKLKEQLGKEAVIRLLGGAEAYEDDVVLTSDPPEDFQIC